jgi:hypothetical protein
MVSLIAHHAVENCSRARNVQNFFGWRGNYASLMLDLCRSRQKISLAVAAEG